MAQINTLLNLRAPHRLLCEQRSRRSFTRYLKIDPDQHALWRHWYKKHVLEAERRAIRKMKCASRACCGNLSHSCHANYEVTIGPSPRDAALAKARHKLRDAHIILSEEHVQIMTLVDVLKFATDPPRLVQPLEDLHTLLINHLAHE
ncbi:MAG: hypothetical protein ACI8W7_001719 [Gammaproteobacteria bacterium]